MINDVLNAHQDDVADIKRTFINVFSALSIIVFTFFATLYQVEGGSQFVSMIEYFVSIILVVNLWYLYRTNNIKVSSMVLMTLLFIMPMIIFINGGIEGTGNLWVLLFPMLAYYLLDKPYNNYYIIAYTLTLTIIAVLIVQGVIESDFTWVKIRQTFVVYFIVIIIGHLNESLKVFYIKKMEISLIRMTAILENMQDTYYRLNRAGKLVYVSTSVEKLLGYNAEEIIAHSEKLFLGMSLKKRFIKGLKESQGELKNFEFHLHHKDGTEVPVLLNAQYVLDKEGAIIAIEGTAKGVSELKAAEVALYQLTEYLDEQVQTGVEKVREKDEMLVHQSRMAQMGEMIAMIAHQWRQPLGGITATTADLRLKKKLNILDDETFDKNLTRIESLSEYLSGTINDFRNFFKQSEKVLERYAHEVVEKSVNMVDFSLEKENIKIVIDNPKSDVMIGHANEVMQVIINILKNAQDVLIDNNIEDPEVKVMFHYDEKYAYIDILDNGGGIDDAILPKIFDPYFSTKDDKNGTGLGLYMSKTIISDHCRGFIDVENTETGAKFTLTLPIVEVTG